MLSDYHTGERGRAQCDHETGLVKRTKMPVEQAWCGAWCDCPMCGFSRLEPSPELEAQLAQQATDQSGAEGEG